MGQMIIKGEGLKPNYYALYLSITNKMTVTKSIMAMGINVDQQNRKTAKHIKLTGEGYMGDDWENRGWK